MKPSERIDRIMRLAQLANNASVSSHVTAALEHCVALFQELAADVEALKQASPVGENGDTINNRLSRLEVLVCPPRGLLPQVGQLAADVEAVERERQYTGHRTAPIDDPSDPMHPLSQARERRRECWVAEYEEDGVLCWGSCRFRHDLEKTCPPGTELHRMVELSEGERVVQPELTATKSVSDLEKLLQGDPMAVVVLPNGEVRAYKPLPGSVVLTAEQAERVRGLIAVVPRLRNVEISDDEPVVEEILDAYSKLKVDDLAALVGIEVDR